MIDRINQLQISKTNMHAGIFKKRRGYQAEGREESAEKAMRGGKTKNGMWDFPNHWMGKRTIK